MNDFSCCYVVKYLRSQLQPNQDVKMLLLHFVLFFGAVSALITRQAPNHARCRFASLFTQDEIRHNSSDFEANIFYWDGQFHGDGIGYRASNGITIGHTTLGYATGLPSSRLPQYTQSTPRNEVGFVAFCRHY